MARVVVGVLSAAVLLVVGAVPASAAGYTAGAAAVITTPPKAGTPEGNAADAEFAPELAQRCSRIAAGSPCRSRSAT